MTELMTYISQALKPADVLSVKVTLEYLTACKRIFEQGLLNHMKVSADSTTVIENIKEGYLFFFKINKAWDLLRIDVYGFFAFTEDFIPQHPNHFIAPLRVQEVL